MERKRGVLVIGGLKRLKEAQHSLCIASALVMCEESEASLGGTYSAAFDESPPRVVRNVNLSTRSPLLGCSHTLLRPNLCPCNDGRSLQH